jgi:hypothetical protein
MHMIELHSEESPTGFPNDDDLHVFDNVAQDEAIHTLYAGMSDDYMPTWERGEDDDDAISS